MTGHTNQLSSPAATAARRVRRPRALVFLHWVTLLLIALTVGLAFVREGIEERTLRTLLINLHRSLGLAVGVLALARIVVRLAHHPLAPHDGMSLPARVAAEAAHLGLYVLLLALPAIGWALSSAHGAPVSFFGLFTLPSLVGRSEDLGDDLAEYHEDAAWLLLGLIAVHALAALWHHYVRRDEVLRAMLPARFVDGQR